MSATQLIADLARLGIQIEAHGDRLRYSPRSAVTPDLADRMKSHKGELLASLRGDDPEPWSFNGESQVECDADGWPVESIDIRDVKPCSQCGGMDLWQNVIGDWRCQRCDPPTTRAKSLRERVCRRKFAKNVKTR